MLMNVFNLPLLTVHQMHNALIRLDLIIVPAYILMLVMAIHVTVSIIHPYVDDGYSCHSEYK